VNWVLDLDIRTFFDSVDPGWLMRMLGHRIADPRVLRLIERWLRAGVLERSYGRLAGDLRSFRVRLLTHPLWSR
jgi:retron-type reverse transcriptase